MEDRQESGRDDCHAAHHAPTGGFGKRDRILTLGEYRRVYRRGFFASSPRFGCYVLPTRSDRSRLGISVSRKFGKSPRRNLVKRRVREVFRRLRHDLPAVLDLVVVPRRGAHRAPLGLVAEDLAVLVREALRTRMRRRR